MKNLLKDHRLHIKEEPKPQFVISEEALKKGESLSTEDFFTKEDLLFNYLIVKGYSENLAGILQLAMSGKK